MAKTGVGIKLLMTTTALSVAIGSFSPLPLAAQEAAPQTTAPAIEPTTPVAPVAPVIEPEITPAPQEPEAASPVPEPDSESEEAAPEASQAETPEPAPEAGAAEDAPPAPETEDPAPTESETQPEAAPEQAAPEAVTPEADPAPSDEAPEQEAAPEQGDATPAPEAPTPEPSATPEPSVTPEQEASPQPDATEPADAIPEAAEPEAPASTVETNAQQPATEPTEQAVESLKDLVLGEAAATSGAVAATQAGGDATATTETTTEVTETDTRSSSEDFTTTASGERRDDDKDDDDGLSNLQKVGLLALGGLAVGALLNNGDQVVANTGDRVVVQQDDGNYVVLKDDDALLRQPGSTVRTENFTDGSTRSTVDYSDGTRIVTVRDASGRVLRRDRIVDGTETRLIDDTTQVAPVDVSLLPRGRDDILVPTNDRAALRDALERIETRDNARGYSLAQIRDYRQVRALAPVVDVNNITFATGSAAVTASQAENLADLGNLLRDLIADRPNEIFLVEGHTDAVGSAASNLALSDRRAESVALALTEYFDVPPENLVVQGYGESDLRVETDANEPRNRRVAVRILTPILQTAQR